MKPSCEWSGLMADPAGISMQPISDCSWFIAAIIKCSRPQLQWPIMVRHFSDTNQTKYIWVRTHSRLQPDWLFYQSARSTRSTYLYGSRSSLAAIDCIQLHNAWHDIVTKYLARNEDDCMLIGTLAPQRFSFFATEIIQYVISAL